MYFILSFLLDLIGPNDYYAVIPYKDINKLFELLNKHVSKPVKHIQPTQEKKKKKTKKKDPPKDTITTFRIPQEKKKKKEKHGPGRKKVIEICANSNSGIFALFAFLGRTFVVLDQK